MAKTLLERSLTSTVSVLKNGGEAISGVAACVQKELILIVATDVLIESGDLIQNPMSNGGVDTYEVIDPNFIEAISRLPAHYQLEVKKLGVPDAKAAVQHITNIHMSGHNSRVNSNSSDSSVNVVNMSPDLQGHVDELRAEIQKANLSEEDFASANEIVNTVESELNKPNPSQISVKLLLDGLSAFGSIASLASITPAILSNSRATPIVV